MLVLERRRDQGITINIAGGEKIHIVVVEIRRDWKVRLGFEASPFVTIYRDEIQAELDAGRGRDRAELAQQRVIGGGEHHQRLADGKGAA